MPTLKHLTVTMILCFLSFTVFVVLASPTRSPSIDQAKSESIKLAPSADAMFSLERAEFALVPPNHILATIGDTLYMLNSKHRIVWKQIVGDVVGQPFVMPNGNIHVLIAQDKLHVVIDGRSGKTLNCIDCNTTARTGFTQMLPYSQTQYLVVESSALFRQNEISRDKPDNLTLWEGEKVIWSTTIPPDAQVRVVGKTILAIVKSGEGISFREVVPPKNWKI